MREMTSLAIVTPTRRRWHWLSEQANRLAGQLHGDDRWIVAIDNDRPPPGVRNEIEHQVGKSRLVWLECHYARPNPPAACVNRLRNAATALASSTAAVMELDDHDLLEPYALSEIRAALEAGYDYVFGWHCQQAVVESPDRATTIARWPDVRHCYSPGAFERGEIEVIGVRAFTRELWNRLRGWSTEVWPGGDYDFALRAERAGARIACIEQPLVTVTVEAESLSAEYRGGREGGKYGRIENRESPLPNPTRWMMSEKF